ncbi:hypothetical protein [Ferrovibrio terrae]|uniref:ImuA family protein n=1 Tax=Ferrovibrio terrae TaxID=2594003 RepID=UPI0031380BB7
MFRSAQLQSAQLQSVQSRSASYIAPSRFGAGLLRQFGRFSQGLTLGVPQIDILEEFARGALHDIVGDAATVSGFLAALLGRDRRQAQILWVTAGAGLHAPALAQLGLDHRRLTVVTTPRAGDRCWAAEEGLDALGYGAVVAEIGDADFHVTQRLQDAAEKRGATAFLVRQNRQPSAAAARWSVQAAASDGFRPCWRLTLECRHGVETDRSWLVEWDQAGGSFRLVR